MEPAKDNNIVCITIHHCDNLKSNILLLQPVLYMHVIDAKTGVYLKKSERNRAVVSYYENQRDDVDYIMPLMTQPCSISGEKLTLLSWEEDFILNEEYTSFTDKESNIMLFFEIGDLLTISHARHQNERLLQNGMQKIAWAFLKLLGSNGVMNTGSKLRLQLYKPSKPLNKKKSSSVEVYEWWLKKSRIPMDASLYITVKPHAPFSVQPALRSMLPIQQEKGSTTFEKLSISNRESSPQFTEESESNPVNDQNTKVIWTRKAGERCKIPRKKKLLLDVVNCCQIVKFSAHGRFLAVGCGIHDSYYLMCYQIPSGKLLHKILAHSELIYDLDWSFNDKYILSASGDCTVRMWDSKYWSRKETFVHPSYVYCAKFHPALDNLFASTSYDHIIRIWSVERCQLLMELEAHKSTVCTLCWNASGTKLYSADGIGQIKVWGKRRQVQNDMYQLENEIQPEETMGISINKMMLNPQDETLCLFCSDSVIRIFSLKGELLSSYESIVSSPKLSKGCCSPCGNLLFLCCDKGNVCVWNKDFCDKNDSEFLYDINYGAPSCIEYHPHEHMLALSFWEEGVPIHVYIYEETDHEIKAVNADNVEVPEICKNKMHALTIKNDKPENSNNPKQKTKLKKQLAVGTHIDVTSHAPHKIHGAAKYRTHNLDDPALSGSMDMYSNMQEDYKKESLTAVITKSGQFDVIAVADNSACSDSNTFRSLVNDSVVINRSLKRSERRKKLRDMNRALS